MSSKVPAPIDPETMEFIHELGYMTRGQVAAFRQCSTTTISLRIADGTLPVRYLDGRTPLISLEDAASLHLRYGWRRYQR